MRAQAATARHSSHLRRTAGALVLGCALTLASLAGSPGTTVRADGNSWQNTNGTSTTGTGSATVAGSQPAMVFAFDTDNPVSGCSSPAGSCSIATPDGANSFEVFTSSPTATLTFSVTTAAPIACDFQLGFKVSFDGALPYSPQPPLIPANTCNGQPPGLGTACPVSNVRGFFEPAQAVWQDDPVTSANHFPDKPGKQLTQTSPTSYTAELPMVQNKPTLLFGIDHAQNALADAPHDRYDIVIRGVTTGETQVPVKMHFSGSGAGSTLDYTSDVFDSLYLDGPCGEARPFTVSLPATFGVPSASGAAFTFTGTGGYTLKDQLVRSDDTPTGLEVDVSGTVVRTHSPITYFVPVRISAGGATTTTALQAASNTLRDQSDLKIPDYYPLSPGSFIGFNEPMLNLTAQLKTQLKSWTSWASSLVLSKESVARESLLAVLTDEFALGAVMGNVGRTVVVLSPEDMAAVGLSGADGLAASSKVVFVRSTATQFTVAHEIAHTLPYLWTSAQMLSECGTDYHNKTFQIAHGFQVTMGGVDDRAQKDPYASFMSTSAFRWVDQCTYWNLLNQLQTQPDPPVLLVRGRLGTDGHKVIGQLLAPYQVNSSLDLSAGSGGVYAIVARSRSGAVLGRYPFTPHWADDMTTRHIISFAYRIPATPGVARLDLVGPGGRLSALVSSAQPPTVSITSPRNAARVAPVGGAVRVTWTGHDPGGHGLLYTVLYSSDGGATWQSQAVEQTATSLAVHLSAGKAHLVRVVVTNGTRSAQATVGFSTP